MNWKKTNNMPSKILMYQKKDIFPSILSLGWQLKWIIADEIFPRHFYSTVKILTFTFITSANSLICAFDDIFIQRIISKTIWQHHALPTISVNLNTPLRPGSPYLVRLQLIFVTIMRITVDEKIYMPLKDIILLLLQ